jgi:RNA polymerase sigma factor (sigma-70 family)
MSKYNPDFWEVSVSPDILESVLEAPDMLERLLVTPEESQAVQDRRAVKQQAVEFIRELIRARLSPRQRRIVELYFYQEKTQQEIATELGINQQVVSKHLFGVLRDGQRVGGALKKLRKLCEQTGVDPKKWV